MSYKASIFGYSTVTRSQPHISSISQTTTWCNRWYSSRLVWSKVAFIENSPTLNISFINNGQQMAWIRHQATIKLTSLTHFIWSYIKLQTCSFIKMPFDCRLQIFAHMVHTLTCWIIGALMNYHRQRPYADWWPPVTANCHMINKMPTPVCQTID